jgi:hypothetical protein
MGRFFNQGSGWFDPSLSSQGEFAPPKLYASLHAMCRDFSQVKISRERVHDKSIPRNTVERSERVVPGLRWQSSRSP